ncbi:MAG: polysaccharide deacetylase family protein, partial [Lachnospiraceae bacterium]|nr:polysaccharide deacetylase family protein [Lachnospiraceae bacterium]
KEPYEEEYRRILAEGHTLGMHSYSHVYRDIYSSKEAFIEDLNMLQEYLHDVTGAYPQIYRFPGGSGNRAASVDIRELTDYLAEIDVTYYDWNISSGDATGRKLSSDQIIANCTRGLEQYETAIILMHDAADKKSTVDALPGLIEKILSLPDTVIVPITDDIMPVQQRESNKIN